MKAAIPSRQAVKESSALMLCSTSRNAGHKGAGQDCALRADSYDPGRTQLSRDVLGCRHEDPRQQVVEACRAEYGITGLNVFARVSQQLHNLSAPLHVQRYGFLPTAGLER